MQHLLLKLVGNEGSGALDKSPSLTSVSANINARLRNTWKNKLSMPESADENNWRRRDRKHTEECFGNTDAVLTMPCHHPFDGIYEALVCVDTELKKGILPQSINS